MDLDNRINLLMAVQCALCTRERSWPLFMNNLSEEVKDPFTKNLHILPAGGRNIDK